MNIEEWQKDLIGMVLDINPAEIGSHLEDLGSWCKTWQVEMIRRIFSVPTTFGRITIPVQELGKQTDINKTEIGDDPNKLNTITTVKGTWV